MIVSALLTSVGINFGLCVLFFTLYSVLRKQPGKYGVYIPRLLTNGKAQQRDQFHIERLIPTAGWVKRAWRPSEQDLLESSGLDAVVFMRIIIFSLRLFCVAGVIGVFVLIPLNCSGNQLANIEFANVTEDSLDVFSISNVNTGSKKLHSGSRPPCSWLYAELWIHFAAVYVVTIFVWYLLYYEYGYISSLRLAYLYASKPKPEQFTVLVRSIPVSPGTSVSDTVDSFFTEYHPSTYLSHVVIRRTNRIQKLINDMKKLSKAITDLRSEPTHPRAECSCCCGLFKHYADRVDRYEKKLENLEENLRYEQSEVSLHGEEVRAAFVSFKTRYDAALVFHIQQSNNPTKWVAEQAPEPRDIYWPFFSSSFMGRWISKLVVIFAFIAFTVIFLLPVVFVQGLTNLDQLEIWFPFLTDVLSKTILSQVITGYLPSFILQMFLRLAPPVMMLLSSLQGFICNSSIEKSACNKVVWFLVWNVFFGNVLSGSVLTTLSILLEPKTIPSTLAITVPAQASFFITYVVTQGWTSASTELVRVIPLICSLFSNPCMQNLDEECEASYLPYHKDIPKLIFFGVLGITYFFLAPLILPFLLIYFCLAYIIFRNQLINVYVPQYETGGKFWPIVHNSMIFSLVLMHSIAFGIFTLKKLPVASALILPLLIMTLIFNSYCRKRFLPNFIAYSAESLIKKDRADQKDPAMADFFNTLTTAYQDPALLPIQHSTSSDGLSSPLLSTTETLN